MPKPILFIMAKQAADDIRSGLSDVAMMRKYGISASVLEKLLKKLVDKGEIDRSDIEERMRLAELSHVVDLVTLPVPELKKTRVNADDAVSSIRSGMSDIELMEKYNVSARGLDSLFKKLIEAGQIDRFELESRKYGMEWGEIAFASGTDPPEQIPHEDSSEHLEKRAWFTELTERHRVLLAGITGAIIGGLAVGAVYLLSTEAGQSENVYVSPPARATSVNPSEEGVRDGTQEVIRILKDIHTYDDGGRVSAYTAPSPYEECLKRCEGEFDPRDQMERGLFFNCKKSCLQEHSERFRKIRHRYYAPPSIKAR
jgi:DNA-binding Lrp family transcriptional regulator